MWMAILITATLCAFGWWLCQPAKPRGPYYRSCPYCSKTLEASGQEMIVHVIKKHPEMLTDESRRP